MQSFWAFVTWLVKLIDNNKRIGRVFFFVFFILFYFYVTECTVCVQDQDPLTFSFLSSFLFFDWVGVLWPQLSKVLKRSVFA